MRYPPLDVMLSWPDPNYINPENRGPALLIVELTILPLALICLALRLWVRIRMLQRFWYDDVLMIAAAFCCCGVTISVILATQRYGWNIHIWDLTSKQMVKGRQVSIAGQSIFLFASGFSKLSILVSYLRIAVVGSWFRRLTWVTIAIVTAAIPSFLLLLWLQCRPASSYWNLLLLTRDCIPEGPPLMGQTTTTVLTDFMVYVLPMPTLWNLKLPLPQRVSLMVLFGFGSVVVIAGCMRTYYIHYVEYQTYDVTWEGFYLWIWAAVEANLGVICGCAPVLKPLLWPSKSGVVRSGYGYTGQASNTTGSRQWTKKKVASRSSLDFESDEDLVRLNDIEAGNRQTGKRNDIQMLRPLSPDSSDISLGLPIEKLPRSPQSTYQQEGRSRSLFTIQSEEARTGLSAPPYKST
ncbi:hypothetical protein F5Y15DRAFT_414450 [Xylariaceae sp. FL0016]|nr:hypothetical protein F5Y15DRAFT_414450 [Xylariaceae sp. FL0016]